MDSKKRLVNSKSLKTGRLSEYIERAQLPFMRYDNFSDSLILMIVPNSVETVVHDIDDHVSLIYEPSSLEVVGFQVEAFEHSFISKYAAVENVWKLSDTTVQLEDVEDLILVLEEKKREVARELKNITDDMMSGLDMSGHLQPA